MLAARALWWVVTSSVTRAVASIGTGRYGGDASKGVARGRAVMAGHHGAPLSDSAAGHTRRMNVVRAVPASGTHGRLLLPASLPPSLSLSSWLFLCVRVTFSVSLYPAPLLPALGTASTAPPSTLTRPVSSLARARREISPALAFDPPEAAGRMPHRSESSGAAAVASFLGGRFD
eukprot:COSAG01_NODE_649_length_14487_cov_12.974624_14_plen_175_part_00